MDIDSEIIIQRKIEPLIYVYIMIIIVIMLSLIILFILLHYKTYYITKGIIVNDHNQYYINIYIPTGVIKYITDNNVVVIDDIEYKYHIVSIDSEYFTDNVDTYQIIKIETNILDKYKFNNMTVELKFLKENKRVIDYILDWRNR